MPPARPPRAPARRAGGARGSSAGSCRCAGAGSQARSPRRACPSDDRDTRTLEEFDFTFQRSVRKQVIEHLGQLDFLHARENVVLLGPPGTGKSHLAIAISIRACLAGQRVIFHTATEWVALLAE